MQLTATDLHYRYARNLPDVLAGAELMVPMGRTVAISGPSGSGKTTLLALLGGLLRPREGHVRVEGARPETPAENVAWVLQTVNVLPDRSVLDNAALGAFGDGANLGSARERAREALGQVGLGPLVDRPIRTLSGGETQRVVIARALCSLRPFILADEPTGQLDRRTTDGVLESLLTDTHGKGVVIVTHDPTVAHRCDRTVYLVDGALVDHVDAAVGA
jgi:ABC-type lipoprotein export system ATPase subunit